MSDFQKIPVVRANNICCYLLLLLFSRDAYSQLTFTIINPTGNYSITCTNTLINLSAASNYTASPVSYTWQSTQSGSVSGNSSAIASPGIYTVSASAGSLTASQTLAIGINTTAPTLTVTTTGSVINCLTGSIQLLAFSSAKNVVYSWIAPIFLPTPGFPNNSYLAYVPGTFTVQAKNNTNGCISKSTITIADNRNYPVLSQPGPFTISCPNGTVDIGPVTTGTNTNFNYQWLTPAGAITGATNTSTLTTSSPGIYKITVTDPQNGCTSQSTIEVWACTAMDKENRDDLNIKVFPNPVRNTLHVRPAGHNSSPWALTIYNPQGQSLYRLSALEPNGELDLSFLPEGVYYLDFQNESGQQVLKILKK